MLNMHFPEESRIRKMGRHVMISFVALLALFLIFLILRGQEREIWEGQDIQSPCLQFDRLLGHSYIPGCRGLEGRGRYKSMAEHNSLGLRDKDYVKAPPKNAFRILLLGGSDVYSMGISQDTMFSRVVAKRLSAKAGYPVEVINASAEGYSSLQMEAWLPKLLQEYSPELVVVNYSGGNSLVRDRFLRVVARFDTKGNLLGFSWLPQEICPEKIMNLLISGQSSYRFWYTFIQQSIWLKISWRYRLLYILKGAEAANLWLEKPALDSLERMSRLAANRGAQFKFVDDTGAFTNYQYLGLGLNNRMVRAFNFFQPRVKVTYGRLQELFRNYLRDNYLGFPKEVVLKKYDNRFRMDEDEHLNQEGIYIFANEASDLIFPLLPKGLK